MKRCVTMLMALVILVASGLVHGFWSERWSPSTVGEEAAARVDKVPLQIGAWQAQAVDADPAAFMQAGARTFWTRSYASARRKTALLVILMCGRAGRMAVHTPEVCYRGAGFEMGGKPELLVMKSAAGDELGTFWTARFFKGNGASSGMRLYWAWSAGGSFQGSANPRWEYGAAPFLYKLYLSYDVSASSPLSAEAIQDFMRQFLPELRRTLLETSS